MKKLILFVCLFIFSGKIFAQQYSQYNTGTLYDSFENPSVRTFIPDSSHQFAFNFFLPGISTNLYITGNGQVPLKNRAFNGIHITSPLAIDQGRFNRANVNANIYWAQFKIFTSLNGDEEIGISLQTKGEGRGLFSDESLALYNGFKEFSNISYNNIFNDNYYYQAYHQVSFTYRERINKKVAFGFKLSSLLGIQYQKLGINQSSLQLDPIKDEATIGLQGKYLINYTPGKFTSHDLLPTFRNPGASISMGASITTKDNFIIQVNLKDLGFIHWSGRSSTYNFNSTDIIEKFSVNRGREDSIYRSTYKNIHKNQSIGSFTTPTNGKFQLSANKSYWVDDDHQIRYSPTLIVSKDLFYNGYELAMVNPFKYHNYTVSLTSAYNNYGIFSIGPQFMVKSSNAEFFIGSERLFQSASLAMAAGHNNTQINKAASFTGADFFMGVSFKFGYLIEHPMNASYIPSEENKGFFVRLYNRLFHKEVYN